MIYLGTSAMLKRVVRDNDSYELIEWLNDVTDDGRPARATRGVRASRVDCCTAQIGRIELMRAAVRIDDAALSTTRTVDEVPPVEGDAVMAARRILDKVDTLLMTPEIAALAQTIPPSELRTLDAIHLATVLVNKSSVTIVCAYDRRFIAACDEHDLDVIAPGTNRGR